MSRSVNDASKCDVIILKWQRLLLRCNMKDHQPRSQQDEDVLTDEEAERALPCNALALRRYRLYRQEGNSTESALSLTLKDWRDVIRSFAYVPHRDEGR